MEQILVVDDEIGIRELLSEILRDEGFRVAVAENASQAREARSRTRPDLVLLDIWMPDTDGITLLKEWASGGLLTMPVVMMSGHATIDTAVEATRIGAFDFLEKPIALQKLLGTVERALRHGQPEIGSTLVLSHLGRSQAVQDLRRRLEQVARTAAPLLLSGEPGTGVELAARFLHQPNSPWVEVHNPSVLASAPLDLLQQAAEGLLYVPEVADLNRMEQRGLQLVLPKLEKYRVRLVSATARPLVELAAGGAFDAALFHQISAVSLRVPPLREHREDVPELAVRLLSEAVEAREVPLRSFTTAALNALRMHDWPGNLAQLRNVVRSLALGALSDEIDAAEVSSALAQYSAAAAPDPLAALPMELPLREARDAFERLYLERHIALEKGNMSRVAEKVGLERTHLYRKLKQLGLALPRKGEDA